MSCVFISCKFTLFWVSLHQSKTFESSKCVKASNMNAIKSNYAKIDFELLLLISEIISDYRFRYIICNDVQSRNK